MYQKQRLFGFIKMHMRRNNPEVLCTVSLRTTRADERDVEEWDVSQSEVSRPAGDVHSTCPLSDIHLRSVFLVLSYLCVSALPVVPTMKY